MDLVIFEDAKVNDLSPITLTRPAYAITCGGVSLIEFLMDAYSPARAVSVWTRPHLCATQGAIPGRISNQIQSPAPTMVVNARLIACGSLRTRLNALATSKSATEIWREGTLLAAWYPQGIPNSNELKHATCTTLVQLITDNSGAARETCGTGELLALQFPHDIVRLQLDHMSDNLSEMTKHDWLEEVADGVFAGKSVEFSPQAVTDTKNGPIVLKDHVTVRPFAFLRGPIVVGESSRINEHASVKDGVCVGSNVKIGGEVERSTIESFSNKAHTGFLGHSYLGSWVNLGAGTSNSNLKNTYGMVRVRRGNRKIETGMQFLGCVIGDYSKSAINASIYTGLSIGAASSLYGTATENIPSFVNYAKSMGSVSVMSVESMIATQGRVFARRGIEQREMDMELLREVFELTINRRTGLVEAPPSFS